MKKKVAAMITAIALSVTMLNPSVAKAAKFDYVQYNPSGFVLVEYNQDSYEKEYEKHLKTKDKVILIYGEISDAELSDFFKEIGTVKKSVSANTNFKKAPAIGLGTNRILGAKNNVYV